MKLTLGFSPCPNDTFIFDALVNKKIHTGDFELAVILEDVQTLNKWAKESRLDISKISYGVLPLLLNEYILLNSGGALGTGVGPLLIATSPIEDFENNLDNLKVVIPGENTTAHMLFTMAFPNVTNKHFVVFNEVEDLVLKGEADAGVIIHENRFTYAERGLVKWLDMGEFWEKETGVPIPLGGIVAKRSLPLGVLEEVNSLIKKSIEYAFEHYPFVADYVKEHSQEMSEDVMRKHIDLYVNKYSLDLGENGKSAVRKLLSVYKVEEDKSVFLH
ncbi:MAG: 1,4-dihydroxy-6-naphthoate synthase [Segetibacter sp.]|nr:1,4-dihydroxy-6-naphthoate synthase [Segetibacter sp.]